MAAEDSSPTNLMHLAADLLDPDLELGSNDLPSEISDNLDEPKEEDIETLLGRAGNYEFVARYQGSAMTDVFLAHKQSRFGFVRRAVVKRARPDSDMYEISREMLLDEAKALAWLDHPNIVAILDFGEDEGGFFLAIEHVDGTDLRYVNMTLKKRREALPFEIASYLAIEILRGLHHAHTLLDPEGQSLDILHRDVNPTNVLISKSGHIKLTDFGVVRMRDRLQAKTQPGIVKGKFSYMAREYILGRKCDCRVDVYAVGIMLLEMLTGRPCFSKLSVHEVMKRIVEHDLPLHRMTDQEIPKALRVIVTRATAREPDDRYENARAMANDLETWLMRTGGHASAWIISSFFEQHNLFRGRRPKMAARKEERAVAQEPTSRDIKTDLGNNINPLEANTPNADGEDIKQQMADIESPTLVSDFMHPQEKTAVSEPPKPIRLQPLDDTPIIELRDEDLDIQEPHLAHIDPSAPWSGSLEKIPVAEVFESLIRTKALGEVCFKNGAIWKRFYVREGQCVAVRSNEGKEDLPELLLQQKVLTRTELERIRLEEKGSDQELGQRLVERNIITAQRFAKVHGQQIHDCLEDVLTWANGDFTFEAKDFKDPEILPLVHIELMLLPYLTETKRKPRTRSADVKSFGRKVKTGGSLAAALRMAREVTQGNVKGRIDRIDIDADDE